MIDGFYAAYVTGAAAPGLAMLALRNGRIVGTDLFGVRITGAYKLIDNGAHQVLLTVTLPPNISLVQGSTTGPQGDVCDIAIDLPADFLALPFLRVETKYGPVNVRFVRLGDVDV